MHRNGAASEDDYHRARRLDFAMRALSRTPVSIYYQNDALVYEWSENLPEGLAEGSVVGKSEAQIFPERTAERLVAVKRKVLRSGRPQRFDLPVSFGEHVRWFDFWIDPEHDHDARVIGIFSTAIEITEQKRKEVQLKNLLREVSHRSKNLLAIILSLASQTARNSHSVGTFTQAFSGRLQAISRAQDLVTDRDWRGALLSDLIERQLALFHESRIRAVRVEGEDFVLGPNASLYVGLALHELCAHALRGKENTHEDAKIVVHTQALPGADGQRVLRLEWSEWGMANPDADFEQLSRAFLQKVVPLAVDGRSELKTEAQSLSYRLDIDGSHIA